MARGTRYSQDIQNLARERGHGMVKIAYDGRFLREYSDKVPVSMEGPACPVKFEAVRKFLWAFGELPSSSKTSDEDLRKIVAGKFRKLAEEFER